MPPTQPKRIGHYCGIDKSEYILPDVSCQHITGEWRDLTEYIVSMLTKREGVSSVYIRGSIPRGLAIRGVSDADFIYFSEADRTAEDKSIEDYVKIKFPFLNGLELLRLDQTRFNQIHPPQNRPYFHMLLKTQSLFLAGIDYTESIDPFKVGLEMVGHAFSLSKEFAKLPEWLEEDRKKGMEKVTAQWFSRRVVRTGFEVTMNRSGCYTRDLYLCFEQFSKFYPERSEQMHRVLVNCLNGTEDPLQYGELVSFLSNESLALLE